jgi:hypothetical protein
MTKGGMSWSEYKQLGQFERALLRRHVKDWQEANKPKK